MVIIVCQYLRTLHPGGAAGSGVGQQQCLLPISYNPTNKLQSYQYAQCGIFYRKCGVYTDTLPCQKDTAYINIWRILQGERAVCTHTDTPPGKIRTVCTYGVCTYGVSYKEACHMGELYT
jgi:hypothetical protein